jgi:hypothetical protein
MAARIPTAVSAAVLGDSTAVAGSFNEALQIAAPQRAADCGNVPESAAAAYLYFRGCPPWLWTDERDGLSAALTGPIRRWAHSADQALERRAAIV